MNFRDVPMKFGYIPRDFIEVEWALMTSQCSSINWNDVLMESEELYWYVNEVQRTLMIV